MPLEDCRGTEEKQRRGGGGLGRSSTLHLVLKGKERKQDIFPMMFSIGSGKMCRYTPLK